MCSPDQVMLSHSSVGISFKVGSSVDSFFLGESVPSLVMRAPHVKQLEKYVEMAKQL